jgi:WD40 repeat protein
MLVLNKFVTGDLARLIAKFSYVFNMEVVETFPNNFGISGGVMLDDDKFATYDGKEGKIKLWDLKDLKKLAFLTANSIKRDATLCLAKISGGKLASGSSSGLIHIWDVEERKIIKQISSPDNQFGADKPVNFLAVSPSGKFLSSAAYYGFPGSQWKIEICNLETDEILPVSRNNDMVSLAFLSDEILISSFANTTQLWNTQNLSPIKEVEMYPVRCPLVSPFNSAEFFCFHDGSVISLFDLNTLKFKSTYGMMSMHEAVAGEDEDSILGFMIKNFSFLHGEYLGSLTKSNKKSSNLAFLTEHLLVDDLLGLIRVVDLLAGRIAFTQKIKDLKFFIATPQGIITIQPDIVKIWNRV